MTRNLTMYAGFILVFLLAVGLCFSPLFTLPAHGEAIQCGPAEAMRAGMVEVAKQFGGTSVELKGPDAQAYLKVLNQFAHEAFAADDLLAISAPGQNGLLVLIKDGSACIVAYVEPRVHEAAMKAVKAGSA